jgi:hypothetical protein
MNSYLTVKTHLSEVLHFPPLNFQIHLVALHSIPVTIGPHLLP